MANRGHRSNRQLIAAIVIVVVAAAAWIVVRRHEAGIIATGDTAGCWTVSCRDAVNQRNAGRPLERL